MSDPFSVAGSAVGVVSLGLTVCKGLIDYCDAIKGRKEELDTTFRHAQSLQQGLGIIKSSLPKLENDHALATKATRDSLGLLELNILQLKQVVDEFQRDNTSGSSVSVQTKLKAQAKKLSYPFKRENILRLEARMQALEGSLQTMLNGLQLSVNISQGQQLSTLTESSEVASGQIITILEGITTANQSSVERDMRLGLIDLRLRNLHQETTQATQQQAFRLQRIEQEFREMKTLQLQLSSKPDLLRAICQETDQPQTVLNRALQTKSRWPSRGISRAISQGNPRLSCSCTGRRSMKAQQYRAGVFSLSYTTDNYEPHLPNCIYHNIPVRKVQTLKTGFNYLSCLLSATVAGTFSLTTGAGGFSISPSLYFSRVVPNDSKAFALVSIDDASVSFYKATVEERLQILETAQHQILRMFCEREASPRDLNYRGESLFHAFLANLYPEDISEPQVIESVVRFLKALACSGVPVNTMNNKMEPPLWTWMLNNWFSIKERDTALVNSAQITVTEAIIECGSSSSIEPALAKGSWTRSFLHVGFHHVTCFSRVIEAAEAHRCGPLSIAILRRSENEVPRILASQPSSILELNTFGQTPLHLSCGWPRGVELLLAAGASAIIDSLDSFGLCAYSYACGFQCVDALDLLLQAGCCLFPSEPLSPVEMRFDGTFCIHSALSAGDHSATNSLLSCLKERRISLRELATENLPNEDLKTLLDPPDIILDSKAYDVCTLLEGIGVLIPPFLAVPRSGKSIYHLELDVSTAASLYEFGFRDVDATDHLLGLTPLMWHQDLIGFINYELTYWLLSHGARFETRTKPARGSRHNNGATAAHFIAAKAPRTIGYSNWKFSPYPHDAQSDLTWIPATACTISESDECQCSCSTDGCRPVTVFLRELHRLCPYNEEWSHERDHKAFVKVIDKIAKTDDAWKWLPTEIIRFVTFEGLEIGHTCCLLSYYKVKGFMHESFVSREVQYINEVQEAYRPSIKLLEKLLDEFNAKYTELGLPFLEFYNGYWKARMNEVIDELEVVNEEELQKTEELGVVLERRVKPRRSCWVI